MAHVALLLDEDVRVILGEILRQRGHDVIHVLEVGRAGKSDPEQLTYAASEGRAILTHNIRDYILLDKQYREQGNEHAGIIVSDQIPLKPLVQRTLRFLSRHAADEVRNSVMWLSD